MPKTIEKIYVTKEDGSREEFASEKLLRSLIAAGANPNVAKKIVEDIMNKDLLVDRTTSEIYDQAFENLKEISNAAAARYSLRRSLMEFGPTGFPFEAYVAEIFKTQGYEAVTDQVVFGSCVPHEVDVVAWNGDKLIMAEVKYHNEPAGKTDLKVALYVKARYDDLRNNMYDYGMNKGESRNLDEGWLITNTKLTETAVTYSNCAGLKLMSWDYPENMNLRDIITKTKLHPITCLTTLSRSEKTDLMKSNVILCKTIHDNRDLLKNIGLTELKIVKVLEEISDIIKYN